MDNQGYPDTREKTPSERTEIKIMKGRRKENLRKKVIF